MKWGIFVVSVEDWRLEKIRSLLICVIWFRGIDQQVSFGQVTPSLVRKRRTIAQIWVFISPLSLVPIYWMNLLKFRCTLMLRFFQIFSKMKIKIIFRELGCHFQTWVIANLGFGCTLIELHVWNFWLNWCSWLFFFFK